GKMRAHGEREDALADLLRERERALRISEVEEGRGQMDRLRVVNSRADACRRKLLEDLIAPAHRGIVGEAGHISMPARGASRCGPPRPDERQACGQVVIPRSQTLTMRVPFRQALALRAQHDGLERVEPTGEADDIVL